MNTAHPDGQLAAEDGRQHHPPPADENQKAARNQDGQIDGAGPGDLQRQPVDEAGDRR